MKQEPNNEQWLDELREEMNNFQAEVPSDGWDKIMASLPAQPEAPIVPMKRNNTWIQSAAIALVALGLGVAVHYLFPNDADNPILAETQDNKLFMPDETPSEALPETTLHADAASMLTAKTYVSKRKTVSEPAAIADNNVITEPAKEVEEAITPDETPVTEPEVNKVYVSDLPKGDEEQLLLALNQSSGAHKRKSRDNSWSLGVNIGGRNSSGNKTVNEKSSTQDIYSSYVPMHSPTGSQSLLSSMHIGYYSKDVPSTRAASGNSQYDKTRIDSQSTMSWNASLTAQRQLSSHLALETGLSYTRLSENLVTYGTFTFIKQQQTLHYLGIPLRLNISLAESLRWRIYVGGGTMIERSLSVTRSGNRLDANHWQLSANGAAGIQYSLSRLLKVYVEPGATYYFDNHSAIKTSRQQDPLQFNINAGLRFDLK